MSEPRVVVWDPKAPGEAVRYGIDFADRIAATVTLSAPTFTITGVVAGTLVASAGLVNGSEASALFAGGALGDAYEVVVRVNASDGQVLEQTANLEIRRR